MSSWDNNPWSNFFNPHWELICRKKQMTPWDLRNINTNRNSCSGTLPCTNMALKLLCYSRSANFSDFIILLDSSHDSWENDILLVKISKWPKCKFLGLRPQGQEIFWDFIILLDSSHDSWENEVLFVKIEARILDLWLDTFSELKWPIYSF